MATEAGEKLDKGKLRLDLLLLQYFPRACMAVTSVSEGGAAKYCPFGWETVPDGYQRYKDAMGRHQLKKYIEGELDLESGELHDAHIAWNALACLELKLREMEKEGT